MRGVLITAVFVFVAAIVVAAGQHAGAQLAARPDRTPPQSGLVFAHANHEDVECSDCHTGIEKSDKVEDRNFPGMDACANCHDVDDDEKCGTCHVNTDDPGGAPHPERPLVFSHKNHLGRGASCQDCHGTVGSSTAFLAEFLPDMPKCFACHDGSRASDKCETCHSDKITLADIHPGEWRHQHGALAAYEEEWCGQCHQGKGSCVECHRGDNLDGKIHDLNFIYTHGMEAKSKRVECIRCHDNETFCNGCHQAENRIPLLHSTMAWLTNHGAAARRDVEDCAGCHDGDDPTCARGGCHRDADGIRGTDPRFHASSMTLFDVHGPWHGGDNFCFRCHVDTGRKGTGFCGYCHGE